MEKHVDYICKTAYFHIFRISKIRSFLDTKTTTTLVHAFVLSRLDVGNSLLYGLPQALLTKLQRVQNCAARLVCMAKRSDHITPLLMQLHWLPIRERINYKILVMTHRIVNGSAPSYLVNLLTVYQPVRSLRSSNTGLLEIPKTRLVKFGDRAFAHAGPCLWNDLPRELRAEESEPTFKKKLKTMLFKRAYDV